MPRQLVPPLLGFALGALAAAGSLTGCAGPTAAARAVDTWVGAPATLLRAQWGPPSSTRTTGDDTVLVYERSRRLRVAGTVPTQVPRTGGGPPMTIPGSPAMDIVMSCTWTFTARAGQIVHTDVRGNDCSHAPGPSHGG